MATVVQPIIEPNREAIKAHLEALFAPVRGDYPNGLVEVCHGSSKPDQAAYFGVHDRGLAEAAEFAANRNREGQNVYVGVNPRKSQTNLKGRASDTDVEISFYHFADLDRADAVAKARENLPVRPTMIVMTGTVPNNRPHFYWQLEEPTGNMPAWTEGQRGIAQTLDGDAVINPSRIMRLAGTVNYPSPDKFSRGYRVEVTSVRTDFASERSPVTPELIAQAFPQRRHVERVEAVEAGETTLSTMSRRTRVSDLINACRSGDQWHNSMVRLVAHLVSTGRTDAEILGLGAGITLPGYTVDGTLREMLTALRGARTKWAVPEPQDDVEAEESGREEGDSTFDLLDLDQLEDLPPPTWLIDELIADHGLSIVYGDPGAGKSFIVLDMALRLAFGMDWHGVAVQQTGVLYIAGEGARGLGKRVKGWRREHALEGADAPFLLLPVAVQMLEPKDLAKLCRTIDVAVTRANFKIGLVVVDTVSRALAGQDENGQESMSAFVSACGEIQVHTGGAVIGVHHSGKDKERGMRGSTVLLGGCDASMKVTKSEQIATIQVEKQKDAEEAKDIRLMLKKVEWATGFGKEESTLVPTLSAAEQEIPKHEITKIEANAIFSKIDFAWAQGAPWSNMPQAKRRGRYLPDQIFDDYRIDEPDALQLIEGWLRRGYLAVEIRDARNKVSGLKVIRMLEQD